MLRYFLLRAVHRHLFAICICSLLCYSLLSIFLVTIPILPSDFATVNAPFLVLCLFPLTFSNYFPTFFGGFRDQTQWNGSVEIVEDVYHSADVFRRDYDEMERKFKIYAYRDGDEYEDSTARTIHWKYASESYFFKNIRESSFLTDDPHHAHLFFIPLSCHKIRQKVSSYQKMESYVKDYVEGLILKYPYWNRTLGSDHFFVSCHEFDLGATQGVHMLVKNSIRAACSSSYRHGFIPHKDFAVPQINQPFAQPAGGYDLHRRTILGYWEGKCNSDIRKKLVHLWGEDEELDFQNQTVPKLSTIYKFYSAKFCICPASLTHTSARITRAIHYGCVPVILGDHFDLPFVDILEWRKFALLLKEADVYKLKDILKAKAGAEYRMLHNNLLKVQKHFQWNAPPVKFDAFHMVIYDLWLRRNVVK
ncbi:putative glycosyltransferase At5g03795 isoform X1 [Primulina tabacum]|uniref:putative glycosyltransferase At5g03795 isoform X1 n=1 Tax=Primulina tabacum TaxID=48773 RepID=UPI003F59822B